MPDAKAAMQYNLNAADATEANMGDFKAMSLQSPRPPPPPLMAVGATSAPNQPGDASRTNDTTDNNNMIDPALFSTEPIRITTETENHRREAFAINVTSLTYNITNLTHFMQYEIRIWACQNQSVDINFCSGKEASFIIATKPDNASDVIREETFHAKNVTDDGTLDFEWLPPLTPNGRVRKYEVEIWDAGKEQSAASMFPQCPETNSKWPPSSSSAIRLRRSLPAPGNYSVRVRAITDAGKGPWTRPRYVHIPNPSSDRILLVVLGLALCVCCMGAFAAVIAWRCLRGDAAHATFNPTYIPYCPDQWELNRAEIVLKGTLGEGTFGKVVLGESSTGAGIMSHCGSSFVRCAVKMLKKEFCDRKEERNQFLYEAQVWKSYRSHHIVTLYGVVSSGQPALILMEFMEHGNLRDFLHKRKEEMERAGSGRPDVQDVLVIAAQIADGMAYLESQRFMHRDLAARNCMVAADWTCKIGDFGMAREIAAGEYYKPVGNRMIPVRWMAPEALTFAKYDHKSDVWAYGVVLWEAVTFGMQPYYGIAELQDVIEFVKGGGTMEVPSECPENLARLMRACWTYDKHHRPSFVQMVDYILPYLTLDARHNFLEASFFGTLDSAQLESQRTAYAPTISVDEDGSGSQRPSISDMAVPLLPPPSPPNKKSTSPQPSSRRTTGSTSGNTTRTGIDTGSSKASTGTVTPLLRHQNSSENNNNNPYDPTRAVNLLSSTTPNTIGKNSIFWNGSDPQQQQQLLNNLRLQEFTSSNPYDAEAAPSTGNTTATTDINDDTMSSDALAHTTIMVNNNNNNNNQKTMLHSQEPVEPNSSSTTKKVSSSPLFYPSLAPPTPFGFNAPAMSLTGGPGSTSSAPATNQNQVHYSKLQVTAPSPTPVPINMTSANSPSVFSPALQHPVMSENDFEAPLCETGGHFAGNSVPIEYTELVIQHQQHAKPNQQPALNKPNNLRMPTPKAPLSNFQNHCPQQPSGGPVVDDYLSMTLGGGNNQNATPSPITSAAANSSGGLFSPMNHVVSNGPSVPNCFDANTLISQQAGPFRAKSSISRSSTTPTTLEILDRAAAVSGMGGGQQRMGDFTNPSSGVMARKERHSLDTTATTLSLSSQNGKFVFGDGDDSPLQPNGPAGIPPAPQKMELRRDAFDLFGNRDPASIRVGNGAADAASLPPSAYSPNGPVIS